MYFEKNLENFAVILKGASVQRLPNVSQNFDNCFMVNNFDRNIDNDNSEWSIVAPELKGKKIVHFVNRLETAPLLPEHYKELNIEHVQFTKSELDERLVYMKGYYEKCGLKCHLLPEELIDYNMFFKDKYYRKPGDSDYTKKHPNTGVIAKIYAAHILKPKNLWIVGLDFYQNDYLFRRPWQTPLELQQLKMKNTDMVSHFMDIVTKNTDVNFKLVTNANVSGDINLEVM